MWTPGPTLGPGKCLHVQGDLKYYLLIREERKRASAHGWPLRWEQSARWDEALLFLPRASLIVFSPRKGSSLNLCAGLSKGGRRPQPLGGPGRSAKMTGFAIEMSFLGRDIQMTCWSVLSRLKIKVWAVVTRPFHCEAPFAQYKQCYFYCDCDGHFWCGWRRRLLRVLAGCLLVVCVEGCQQ